MTTNTSDEKLFYLGDLPELREKLARAERDGAAMGRVWASLRHRARSAPDSYPWFVPFMAVITGEKGDLESAKRQIRNYVATLDCQQFGMGLQFHFWCFAFPHARWSLYFKWLDALGAWTDEERDRILEELTVWQFTNFFYGMRTKPEPECVDNQTLSLCFSNALFGHLFGDCGDVSAIARRMSDDGFRRLPDTLGGFPPSGYSGEGSTYMDYVVGPAIPFVVELLERKHGGDWFNRQLPPKGGSAAAVLKMIAREWMPGGLLLPWDHYGYAFPTRSSIAYAARRTGDPLYFDLLERCANWGFDISIGWGYDDLVWSLIWWPGKRPVSTGKIFSSWAEKDVGGALVSSDTDLYLMQMWDKSSPKTPIREHVNPNSIILSAFGSPLTIDGVASKDCGDFNFKDCWLERGGMDFKPVLYNFGSGCAGAHNVILVDGWEGMRAEKEYPQGELKEFDEHGCFLSADVTPIYRERYPDALQVRRTSRLCADRFWLIEDLAEFSTEHDVTARWFFRPEITDTSRGLTFETAEGVNLFLFPLLGPDRKDIRHVHGYPDRLDHESRMIDFHQKGKICRWLWLAFPWKSRTECDDVTGGWTVAGDSESVWDYPAATAALDESELTLPMEMPPFMLAETPVMRRWWFRKKISRPSGRRWLRLPAGLSEPRIWFNGKETDLSAKWKLAELLPIDVEMPCSSHGRIEIVLKTDTGTSQYGTGKEGASCFYGKALVLAETVGNIPDAGYENGIVHVRKDLEKWRIPHELMKAGG